MEKYRQFGDAGTGKHPFVPLWSHYRLPLVLRLLKVFFFPVALVRLVVFAVAMVWLALAEVVNVIIPVGPVKYPIYRFLTYVGCTVALMATGVVSSRDELADYRRLKLAPPKHSGGTVFNAKRGTVIFANHQGLTDILLLGMKLSPVFVFPAFDGTPVQYTLLGALRRSVSIKKEVAPPTATASLQEIAAKAKSAWQPLVVFAEGTRTVGNAVLMWKDRTFKGMETASPDTALVSLTYSKGGAYTPHHTIGTGLMHIFWLTMQIWPHTVATIWLESADVSAALKGKPMVEQTALLRTLLTRMIREAVEVEVGVEKHLDFMAYWNDAHKKAYTQKKRS